MKLTKLTLDGFKSFAQRTEINFDYGTTVLVGPNGCGKSNVVDAFKWVLGDRSVKSLRGEEMLDVIFNGASDAKPTGFASVSLSMSNSGASDANLSMGYEDVVITRRLHRSGESEYFINNQLCRLKDIRELFMGTGLGMESYSVIEQGKVDVILNSNPFERRELLDEAAGISKYKAKRKESESKLQKVEQDLLRLSDILREVRREIRSIKIQATKAEKYKITLDDLKVKKTQLALHTYHQYLQKQDELSAEQSRLQSAAATFGEQLKAAEEALLAIDKEAIQVENQISSYQDSLVGLSGRISKIQQKIESDSDRRTELSKEEEDAKGHIADYARKAVELRSRIVETMQSHEVLKRELELLDAELNAKSEVYNGMSVEVDDISARLEAKRNEIFHVTHKKSEYHNELATIQNELKGLGVKRDKLSVRAGEIEAEAGRLKSGRAGLLSAHQQSRDIINGMKNEILQKEMVSQSLQNDISRLVNELSRMRDELSRIDSRKEVLEDLERLHDGCSQGVRAVLEANLSSGIYGLVADILEIKPQYVNAAEAALKGLADALIVNSSSDALAAIKFVCDNKKGRIAVISLDKLKSFSLRAPIPAEGVPGIIGYADEAVLGVKLDQITPELKASLVKTLLGHYLLVDNIDTARQMLEQHLYDGQILTTNGEIIGSNGIIYGGSIEPGLGLISRKTELRDLHSGFIALTEQLQGVDQVRLNKNGEMDSLDSGLQALRTAVYEKSIELTGSENSVAEVDRRIALLDKEIEINGLERAEADQQASSISDRAVSVNLIIKDIEEALSGLQAEMEKNSNLINEYAQKKQDVETLMTELKIRQAKLISQREYFTQQQAQMNEDIRHFESGLESSNSALNEIRNKAVELDSARESDTLLLDHLSGEQSQIQGLVTELRSRLAQLKEKIHGQKIIEEGIHNQVDDIQKSLNNVLFGQRELALKIESLCEKHKEGSGSDLKDSYLNYQPSCDAPEAEGADDWQKVNQAIEELKLRLGEMSDVNLSAIDQIKSLEERNATLTVQEQDLIKSKEALQDFIRKTNRECRERFEKTFEQVAINFHQLFRKLFGGGKAELVLVKKSEAQDNPVADSGPEGEPTAPEGPAVVKEIETEVRHFRSSESLDLGIDIIAKPPGKEPRSISQLSGGEKALAALALVMSIFKLQPSPFCILDESDSPLDENNVDRFCAMVKEFAAETQFIVITHNKKTMLAGDVMYGITMPTPGISKKISIKIDEIDKFIAENPDAACAMPVVKSELQPA